ncbi:MAG TPA: NAD-dependent epimerase/dehydratase family protein [Polyangia bacterium]|jgi:nucleoside-diphosphate-sugar epimerase|nr:NAD-dependent epimerase/dehydratase family protein [Polyangia bacterium]
MRFTVTGATGFIGRAFVRRALADGHTVRALVRDPAVALPDAVERAVGDLTRPETLAPALRDAEAVVHLAAQLGDWGPEAAFVRANVEGTRAMLDAARSAGVGRFVFTSSLVVYGEHLLGAQPCDEDRPFGKKLVSAYARSKVAAERACQETATATFAPTIVRPGNVFGPGSKFWVDEVVAALRTSGVPVVDGQRPLAHLAYVDNVVDVLLRAALAPGAAGRAYNVNDAEGVTWWRYLRDMAAIAGAALPSKIMPGPAAAAIAAVMEATARALRRKKRPLLTRESVRLFRARAPLPITRAETELGHRPLVPYATAMERVRAYVARGVT